MMQQRTTSSAVRVSNRAVRASASVSRVSNRSSLPAGPVRGTSIRQPSRPCLVVAGFYGSGGKKAASDAYGAPQRGGGAGAPFSGSAPIIVAEPVLTEATAAALKRIANFSFWSQLTLSITSAIILFFSVSSGLAPGRAPNVSVYFTLFGVVASIISTFLSSGFQRTARRVLLKGEDVAVRGVESSLLRNVGLNLWGLGATIVGLQATVGGLVAKTLTASTANPYTSPGYSVGAPAALDAFSIQASTNTVLAHFVSIVFANWLLRVLNKSIDKQKAAAAAGY